MTQHKNEQVGGEWAAGGSEGTSILVMSLGRCWGLEHGLQRGQAWASFSLNYCLTIRDGAKLSPLFCLRGASLLGHYGAEGGSPPLKGHIMKESETGKILNTLKKSNVCGDLGLQSFFFLIEI